MGLRHPTGKNMEEWGRTNVGLYLENCVISNINCCEKCLLLVWGARWWNIYKHFGHTLYTKLFHPQRCKQPTRCNKFRLLIFLNQFCMFRATNSPILRSTFWLYIQPLVQCTDIAAGRCIVPKAVYRVKKCSWGWTSMSPETCRADLKR